MRYIVDQLIKTTVRIETAAEGRFGTGTGFCCRFNDKGDSFLPVIITNKHVLDGFDRAAFFLNCDDGGPPQSFTLGNLHSNYVPHPNPAVDLAAIIFTAMAESLVRQGRRAAATFFSVDDIATTGYLTGLGAVENILMIGYPNGLWDQKNNRPLCRTGITATHAEVDFNGKPIFLIDCACFPGSSGSPVVLYDPVVYNNNGNLGIGPRTKLIGVLFAGPRFDAQGQLEIEPGPTSRSGLVSTKMMMNLGFCVRAEELLWFNENLPKIGQALGQEQLSPHSCTDLELPSAT